MGTPLLTSALLYEEFKQTIDYLANKNVCFVPAPEIIHHIQKKQANHHI